jgi:outer membrane protein assembly factor BamB
LAVLVCAAPAASADWLQASSDAARTGAATGTGPSTGDLAWTVRLPGSRAGNPLIIDGQAYVATADLGGEGLDTNGVFRVDLATAQVELFIPLPSPPANFVSDGERLYLVDAGGVSGHGLPGGAPLWTWPFPDLVPGNQSRTACADPAVRNRTVYIACSELAPRAPAIGRAYGIAFVAALDGPTGRPRWVWVKDRPAELLGETGVGGVEGVPPTNLSEVETNVLGVTVVGAYVLVMGYELSSTYPPYQASVWCLDEPDGAFRWMKNETPEIAFGFHLGETTSRFAAFPGVPTGLPNIVYLHLDFEIWAVNPSQGTVVWRRRIGDLDPDQSSWLNGFVLSGDALFTATGVSVFRVDTRTTQIVWNTTLEPGRPAWWVGSDLVLANGTLYAVAAQEDANDTYYALEPQTGRVRWTFPLSIDPQAPPSGVAYNHAFGDGVLVIASLDGSVRVVGRTPASLQPRAAPSTNYPAPGQSFDVDLGGTVPGVFGPATSFRADWGDGAASDWQAGAVLQHAYAAAGERAATFQVRNDAGQTASTELTFHVGATAPAAPGYWEQVFAAQNMPSVLLLLGVAVAGSVGSVVTARRHRRRGRFRRELSLIEEAHARTRDDPAQCEAALMARKERVSELLLTKRLEMAQVVVLERRIDELLGRSRTPGGRLPISAAAAPGDVLLGKYRVTRLLGEGAHGRTYLAEDVAAHRPVVVKVLHPRASGDASLREARAIAAVRHPNVVTLYHVEQSGDAACLVMEYVDGGSLQQRLARGALGGDEFRRVATGVLDALQAVHDAGAVHRDVKPSNVLLTRDGQPKLADFGVAHLPGMETTVGGEGTTVGTVRYMSPEQAKGKPATPRSDLFSAGATLFEAYTGTPYLQAEPNESAVELQMRAARAEPFDQRLEPPALRAWFARALEPDPALRFASARAMREALIGALG